MLKETNNINSICHCERSEAISQKIATPYGLAMTESGRSMVEMLGVLAVIGVLSVAGIAGYSNAMKKHRANEILNEASKRAVLVAARAMTGKTGSIPLTEFTQNTFSGCTFAGTANVADNKITLGLSGSGLADICAQLKNTTGDNTVMKVTKDDCSELTFNADMSMGSGNSEPQVTLVETCASETGTSSSYSGDATNERTEAGDCRCPNNKPQWDGSECKVADTGGPCTDHTTQVCPEGYYCNFNPSYCGSSDWPGTGVCTKITGNKKTNGHWVGPLLDWWSANSWCIGKGSSGLISYTTLQSEYGCNKSGYSCNWSTLEGDGLSEWYWSGEIEDDCKAWYTRIYAKYFDYYDIERDYRSDASALCE